MTHEEEWAVAALIALISGDYSNGKSTDFLSSGGNSHEQLRCCMFGGRVGGC